VKAAENRRNAAYASFMVELRQSIANALDILTLQDLILETAEPVFDPVI
jgi:hypothetical protein